MENTAYAGIIPKKEKWMYGIAGLGQNILYIVVGSFLMEINHCREGRFECEFMDGVYTYLSTGDLAVNKIISNQVINATFPSEHYHGRMP